MPCLYCPNPPDSPEHWLPRSLGEFGSEQILRDRVCGECNRLLGKQVDEEWIRTGPEGVLRRALGIEGRHGAATGNPHYFRASTDFPVQATNPDADEALPERNLLWETVPASDGELRAQLLEQLVLVKDGHRISVPLNAQWNAATLRTAIANRGAEGGALVEVYADRATLEQMRPLLREVLPGFEAEWFERDGAGQQPRQLQFANHLREPYLRGIAKIAFHGALKLLPNLDGYAREFEHVRRWIRFGERPPQPFWRLVAQPILAGLGAGVVLRDWGHVVAVDSAYQTVSVKMQFFVGPGVMPQTWVVLLGRNPARIAAAVSEARYFRYFGERRNGLDGDIQPVHAIKMVRP